jgi:DNA polymerase II small subunit/DNA polymerase delta subunit B
LHQPRKFIYDLFDSLILLGVGGQLIYHGPTEGAEPYFNRRNYLLPLGESVADWLIDISSGRLEPENQVAENRKESVMTHKTVNRVGTKELSIMPSHQESTEERQDESVETKAIARDSVDEIKDFFESDGGVSAAGLNSAGRVVTDGNCVGKKGVTTGKVVQ